MGFNRLSNNSLFSDTPSEPEDILIFVMPPISQAASEGSSLETR